MVWGAFAPCISAHLLTPWGRRIPGPGQKRRLPTIHLLTPGRRIPWSRVEVPGSLRIVFLAHRVPHACITSLGADVPQTPRHILGREHFAPQITFRREGGGGGGEGGWGGGPPPNYPPACCWVFGGSSSRTASSGEWAPNKGGGGGGGAF